MIPAVGYCRFSSENQVDGFSIEAQKNAINEFASRMGYTIIRFYVDEAKFGTTAEGRILGTIPFGYIADKDNKFSIVDKEADIVRCAFENYMGKIKNSLDNPKDTEQITCFLLHNVEG